jgi:hypothetical protein
VNHLPLKFTGLCALAGIIGCTDGGIVPPVDVDKERAPIVNGVLSVSDDDAVVAVLGPQNGCSGTLIAPDVVLTALHCVSDFDPRTSFVCQSDGTLSPDSSGGTLGPMIDPPSLVSVSVGVRVGTNRVKAKAFYGTGATETCRDDLAVIVLESAPDLGSAPLVKLRFDTRTKKRDLVRALGYGDTSGTSSVQGRQERDDMTVLGVGAVNTDTTGDPDIIPNTILADEGPCHGDSGGPLLAEDTGAQVGVYSVLNSTVCAGPGVTNTYTNVAGFEPLIREAMASVGEEPLVDPPPAGTGGSSGSGSGGSTTTGQAGEANGAGAPSDAGAPSSSGGTDVGGSGGSGARGGTSSGATGGTDMTGDDTGTDPGMQGTGSGSRRSGGCTLAAGGSRGSGARSLGLIGLLGLAVMRRRRRQP